LPPFFKIIRSLDMTTAIQPSRVFDQSSYSGLSTSNSAIQVILKNHQSQWHLATPETRLDRYTSVQNSVIIAKFLSESVRSIDFVFMPELKNQQQGNPVLSTLAKRWEYQNQRRPFLYNSSSWAPFFKNISWYVGLNSHTQYDFSDMSYHLQALYFDTRHISTPFKPSATTRAFSISRASRRSFGW
jgi:hypothetical protein